MEWRKNGILWWYNATKRIEIWIEKEGNILWWSHTTKTHENINRKKENFVVIPHHQTDEIWIEIGGDSHYHWNKEKENKKNEKIEKEKGD